MSHGGVASSRASHSSRHASPRNAGSGGIAFIADLADRVLAQLARRHAAADVVDVGQVAIVGALDRDDRPEVRRPQLGDLDRGERAVADAPHPDRAVAPRLGGEPLDGVVAVERLGLGVLVERDARPTSRSRGRRPGTRRSPRAASHVAARRCRRCAASCPCRTGSSRGWPGTAGPGRPSTGARQPQVRRQLDAVARRDPDVPVTARPRGSAGSPVGRPSVVGLGGHRRESTGRPARGGRAAPAPVRRCRPWTTSAAGPRAARGPADSRRVAYENAWITVWHDEVTRPDGAPGIYGVVHFANLAAGVVALDDDDRVAPRRPAPLHARRVLLGDPRGRRARRRDRARRRPARAARGDRRRGAPSGASSPASTSRTRVTDELAVLFLATGLSHGDATPDGTEAARGPLGAVRRGPGDDPRRPDHRRDDRRRGRAPGTPAGARGASWPSDGLTRRDWDAIVVGLGALGSAAAYWLSRSLGARRPRPRAVRARPRQRRVGRPQPDHPALVPPPRLRPAREAGLRDVGRGRGRGGRADRDDHRRPRPVAGRPRHPEGRLHRQPGRRGRAVRAARRRRGPPPLAAVAPRRRA